MRRATNLALAALTAVAKADWDESQHPRDAKGMWADGRGSGDAPAKNYGRELKAGSPGYKALDSYINRSGGLSYVKINAAARESTAGKSSSKAAIAARNLSAAIQQSALPKDQTFFRGTSLPAATKVGDIISPRGFVSVSSSPKIAHRFASEQREKSQAAVLTIKARAGDRVLDAEFALGPLNDGAQGSEQEYLFDHTTSFRVVSDEGRSSQGYRMVTVVPLGPDNLAKAQWDESQHPRDEKGRFGDSGGSSTSDAPPGTPAAAFSPGQRSAIMAYTGGDPTIVAPDSETINRVLRGATEGIDPIDIERAQKIGAEINAAAASYPLTERTTLYRGGWAPSGLRAGSVIQTGSLLSTSPDQEFADQFRAMATKLTGNVAMLIIDAHPGALALDEHKAFGSPNRDRETIIASNQPLHIVSSKWANDADGGLYRVVHAELRAPPTAVGQSTDEDTAP